ncbi:unnamed protein product [Rotaria magnacalcarata]|uniref:Mono(ADP-ribosyl)transferase n=1 Tax=Rotaria magnacalcarata TaxID=392030 RepID=A0A815JA06_9BILA|nr:unnamed protein product [Rotaria magnacalcarata]CAF1617651.1 unnamed protein product [Rotaria magnacalcarata]CAF2162084.1 unnamed protein product [Rotaria magnacalcarata]CAF4077597.1 unnamed protein product [Rotaria magnacalcarata]CAF4099348.1 unnamed protein product [Rotaria magnacalcarata]
MVASASDETSPSLRAAKLGPLPRRMLPPIEGYASKPLVSLEKAVKPLQSIVKRIQLNACMVTSLSENPKDGLTVDESASIVLYTFESVPAEDSLYNILNKTLNSENRRELVPWLLYLRLLLTALDRLPSKRCTIFKGVDGDFTKDYPMGKKIIWWGFSSCTSSSDAWQSAPDFNKAKIRTLFVINCHTGRNIKNHSHRNTADDILLLPAREFVVSMTFGVGNGLNQIHLEEQTPSFPLLEHVQAPNQRSNESQPTGIKSKFASTAAINAVRKAVIVISMSLKM